MGSHQDETAAAFRRTATGKSTGTFTRKATGKVTGPESLGRLLQQARLVRGWSQRQLAARIGTTQRYIWEMEAGKPSIYTDRLFAFMRETGVELTVTITVPDGTARGGTALGVAVSGGAAPAVPTPASSAAAVAVPAVPARPAAIRGLTHLNPDQQERP